MTETTAGSTASAIGIIEISHQAVEAIRKDTAEDGGLLAKAEAAAVEAARVSAGEGARIIASTMLERDCVQIVVKVHTSVEVNPVPSAACGVTGGLAVLFPFCLKHDPRAAIERLAITENPVAPGKNHP